MDHKVSQADVAHAVGLGTYSGNIIPTAGARDHNFILGLGTLASNSVATLKAQHGDAADGSDMADISGAIIARTHAGGVSLTDQAILLEVKGTVKKYIRQQTLITAAVAVVTPSYCFQVGLRVEPPSDGTSIAASNVAPALL